MPSVRLLGVTACVLAVAGCGSGPDPQPTVPTVPAELPYARYHQEPCATLTADRLASIGFVMTAAPQPSRDNPSCNWIDGTAHQQVSVWWQPSLAIGTVYADRAEYRYFEPFDIDGFPAVLGGQYDDRPYGTCEVTVAVGKQSSVLVFFGSTRQSPADTCGRARQVARLVVTALR